MKHPFAPAASDEVHPALRYAVEIAPLVDKEFIEPLRGKNLACWCEVNEMCHADVPLKLATP